MFYNKYLNENKNFKGKNLLVEINAFIFLEPNSRGQPLFQEKMNIYHLDDYILFSSIYCMLYQIRVVNNYNFLCCIIQHNK